MSDLLAHSMVFNFFSIDHSIAPLGVMEGKYLTFIL